MTWHFLIRDFRDFTLGWVCIAIFTIIAIPFGWRGVVPVLWGYFFFSAAGEQHVIGSTVRNQHILSRHFLLSIPCSHKRLFAIQQIRMSVFYFPFSILMLALPFGYPSRVSSPVYLFALVITVAGIIHWHFWTALEGERISSYLPKRQRLWAYIKLSAFLFLPFFLLAPAWVSMFLPLPKGHQRSSWVFVLTTFVPGEWIFVGVLFVLIFLVPHNARRWSVTL
jgi:hypothetical protein